MLMSKCRIFRSVDELYYFCLDFHQHSYFRHV